MTSWLRLKVLGPIFTWSKKILTRRLKAHFERCWKQEFLSKTRWWANKPWRDSCTRYWKWLRSSLLSNTAAAMTLYCCWERFFDFYPSSLRSDSSTNCFSSSFSQVYSDDFYRISSQILPCKQGDKDARLTLNNPAVLWSNIIFQFLIRFASCPYSLAQFFSIISWYLDWLEWHKH